ncbi:hypothetical protein [Acrocarpospora catenulata]|uniref:hypothetical protein n=1 Tax=Acrocarpospora catenulata TaxID=2836182 RepID=UPI001BDAB099|nr:hypothetical protein [Acrocarpospora catenulata]
MKRILIPGLLLAVALPVLATPAHADPKDDTTLTDNALYRSGVIPRSVCAEKPIRKRNNPAVAKIYVNSVLRCLDRVWSKQLAKSGQKFKKPKVSLLTKNPRRFCGEEWLKDWFSEYCHKDQSLVIVLDRRLLNLDPHDLYIFNLTANLYADHVLNLTGIDAAMREHIPDSDDEDFVEALPALSRRMRLQENCLAAAFIGSVYRSMPRPSADWKTVVKLMGKEANDFVGTAKSMAYWMNRGFTTRDPKACNTWSAPDSRVA